MEQKQISSFVITIYGDFGKGYSTLLDLIALEPSMTIADLAQKLGTGVRSLSQICNNINSPKEIKHNIEIPINYNLICDKSPKYINLILEYECSIIVYLTSLFNKIRECINQYSLVRIRGDTLCFNFNFNF